MFSCIQITLYSLDSSQYFFCPARTQGIIIVEGNSECNDAKRQTYNSFKDGKMKSVSEHCWPLINEVD